MTWKSLMLKRKGNMLLFTQPGPCCDPLSLAPPGALKPIPKVKTDVREMCLTYCAVH